MIVPKMVELIDRDELIETLVRSDVSSREKIVEIVYNQQVVAQLCTKFEIELMI